MNLLFSLVVVIALILTAYLGVESAKLHAVFGIYLPYAAVAIFFSGVIWRVLKWARSPVPFRIPTTSGQQKSLPWIKSSNLESPHNMMGVLGRMALEVLFFRSLFRNTKADINNGEKMVYGPEKWLWGAALVFHWSFLIIFIRHFKFFVEPVPLVIEWLGSMDGFLQVWLPILYITDLALVAGLSFLFLRRVLSPKISYISLASDFFPLLLILGIALTGILMRYFVKVDLVGVKELALGLISFKPVIPDPASVNWPFYIHFFLVCTLIIYFPFSKLMHMGGVFLSPTRNLANNNRMVRHINPWNPQVKMHTYAEYEEEFKEKFEAAGLPLDKE
jgi:nitrate reductase gamma subunit